MVVLRLLGSVSLAGEHGPIAGRSAQRRRIALLALLALARGRPVSRDKLIGYLWPESPVDAARRQLSESLYVLRKTLGEGAIESRGDDVVLVLEAVSCDAVDFLDAIERGDLDAAVGHWGGPLLDGFFIGDAPEFERWVDEQRAQLARAYASALQTLAEQAESAGRVNDAVELLRRLAAEDPYNGGVALSLMRALDAAGNRAGAMQHAKTHATLLREDLGAEPDPSVEAYAEHLRTQPNPTLHVPEPMQTTARQKDDAASVIAVGVKPEPATLPVAQRSVFDLIRTRHMAIAAVALLVLALGGAIARSWGPARSASADAQLTVAVLPFDVRSSAELEYLREGLAKLLSTNLDGAGGLRAIDHNMLLGAVGAGNAGNPRVARALTRKFGAHYYVLGDAVHSGSRLRVTARLYDRAQPDQAIAEATAEGDVSDLFALVDDLAAGLLQYQEGDASPRLTRIAAITTPSLPAFKAYIDGERAFRATRYPQAMAAFEHAVQEDSAFALAYYRLSIAAEWSFEFLRARSAARAALRHAERLSERDRLLLGGWHSLLSGEPQPAEAVFREVIAMYGDDVEAWSGLGEVLVHYNPVLGRPATEAKDVFERVISLDPSYGEARMHLLEFAAAARDQASFDSLLAGVDTRSEHAIAWRAVHSRLWGDAAEQKHAFAALERAPERAIAIAAGRLALHAHDFAGSARAAELLLAAERPAEWRATGRLALAQLEAARGRPGAARLQLAQIAERERAWGLELRGYIATLPFFPADRAELTQLQTLLTQWDARDIPAAYGFLGGHNGIHPLLRLYLLGMVDIRLGDSAAAIDFANQLERSARTAESQPLASSLARVLRAEVLHSDGDLEGALDILEGADAGPIAPLELLGISPFYSRASERYLRAELLHALGRDDDALRIFESLTEGYDVMFVAPAHRRQAEILRTSDPARAAEHMRRFTELWRPD